VVAGWRGGGYAGWPLLGRQPHRRTRIVGHLHGRMGAIPVIQEAPHLTPRDMVRWGLNGTWARRWTSRRNVVSQQSMRTRPSNNEADEAWPEWSFAAYLSVRRMNRWSNSRFARTREYLAGVIHWCSRRGSLRICAGQSAAGPIGEGCTGVRRGRGVRLRDLDRTRRGLLQDGYTSARHCRGRV